MISSQTVNPFVCRFLIRFQSFNLHQANFKTVIAFKATRSTPHTQTNLSDPRH